jgi:molybdate transport system ATP-binding protein
MSAELHVKAHVERHGGRDFVLHVDFTAPPGVTILCGPSGSGKSTTLAAIAGLVTPDHGRIALGDEVWFERVEGSRAARRLPVEARGLAFVFQSLALFPHLDAIDNVAYGIDRRLPRDERRARARAMLVKMRVEHLVGRRPATFSGGEAQRVALARAFARSPRLVLLDEPFSALDRGLRQELVALVRGFADESAIPILHVTHHRNEARALGDRVLPRVVAEQLLRRAGGDDAAGLHAQHAVAAPRRRQPA